MTCAQIVHFARKLREIADDYVLLEDGGIIYRLFVDRRWDSLPGIVHARREHGVSYTSTVMKSHRFHVISGSKKRSIAGLKNFVTKSKVVFHASTIL